MIKIPAPASLYAALCVPPELGSRSVFQKTRLRSIHAGVSCYSAIDLSGAEAAAAARGVIEISLQTDAIRQKKQCDELQTYLQERLDCRHENVLHLYEAYMLERPRLLDGPKYVIVGEACIGVTLAKLLRRPMPMAHLQARISDLTFGAAFLQAMQFPGNNLRCENIHINCRRDGIVQWKIGPQLNEPRFQGATIYPEAPHNTVLLAPELRNNELGTAQSDTWAIGCLALMLESGQPLRYADAKLTMQQTGTSLRDYLIQGGRPAIPAHLSEQMKDFLQRCFEPVATRPYPNQLLAHPFLVWPLAAHTYAPLAA